MCSQSFFNKYGVVTLLSADDDENYGERIDFPYHQRHKIKYEANSDEKHFSVILEIYFIM